MIIGLARSRRKSAAEGTRTALFVFSTRSASFGNVLARPTTLGAEGRVILLDRVEQSLPVLLTFVPFALCEKFSKEFRRNEELPRRRSNFRRSDCGGNYRRRFYRVSSKQHISSAYFFDRTQSTSFKCCERASISRFSLTGRLVRKLPREADSRSTAGKWPRSSRFFFFFSARESRRIFSAVSARNSSVDEIPGRCAGRQAHERGTGEGRRAHATPPRRTGFPYVLISR